MSPPGGDRPAGPRADVLEWVRRPSGELDLSSPAPELLVSSQDRRPRTLPPGAVFAVELLTSGFGALRPLALVGRDAVPFHPHGISIVRRAAGASPLYAINHASPRDHRIEAYRTEGDRTGSPSRIFFNGPGGRHARVRMNLVAASRRAVLR